MGSSRHQTPRTPKEFLKEKLFARGRSDHKVSSRGESHHAARPSTDHDYDSDKKQHRHRFRLAHRPAAPKPPGTGGLPPKNYWDVASRTDSSHEKRTHHKNGHAVAHQSNAGSSGSHARLKFNHVDTPGALVGHYGHNNLANGETASKPRRIRVPIMPTGGLVDIREYRSASTKGSSVAGSHGHYSSKPSKRPIVPYTPYAFRANKIPTSESVKEERALEEAVQLERHREQSYADFRQDWVVVKRLGYGTESNVFFCVQSCDAAALCNMPRPQRDRYQYKVKVVKFLKPPSSAARHEVRTLAHMVPPSDPSYLQPRVYDRKQKLWIISNVMRGGTLRTMNRVFRFNFPISLLWHVFIELVEALVKLHASGVAHCDLWSANVFLDPEDLTFQSYPRIVLGDFGRATYIGQADGVMADHDGPTNDRDLVKACRTDVENLGDLIHALRHSPDCEPYPRDRERGTCGCSNTEAMDKVGGRSSKRLYDDILHVTAKCQKPEIDCLKEMLPKARKLRQKLYVHRDLSRGYLRVPNREAIVRAMESRSLHRSVWDDPMDDVHV